MGEGMFKSGKAFEFSYRIKAQKTGGKELNGHF